MKLVIEVPDQVVDMVCNTGTYGYYRFNSTKAIKKGIPLDHVFKDIKAEIQQKEDEPQYQHEGEDWIVGLIMAETIIDKYRESGDKK